ncbi:hypothetical protein ACFL6Y_11015 [Elusimicrobiota bacterium]
MAESKFSNKGKGLLAFLAIFAKVLPVSWVAAMGGPVTAGMIVAAAGGVTIGVPAALITTGAMSSSAPSHAPGVIDGTEDKQSGFASMFGAIRGAFDIADPQLAMRTKNIENEEAHENEETSLGLLIPEEYPSEAGASGARSKRKRNPKVSSVSGKTRKDLSGLKGRFSSKGKSQLSGFRSLGGGGSGGASSGGGLQRSGRGSMGSGGSGSLSSSGGGKGKSRKPGIRTISKFKSRSGGAYDNLKGAAKLSNRAYGSSDQVASGASGAAFGQVPQAAGVVAGGPSAEVSGTPEGDPGMDTVDSDLGDTNIQPKTINPNNTADDEEEDENPLQDLMQGALALLLGGALAAILAGIMPRGTILLDIARYALVAAALYCIYEAVTAYIMPILDDDSLGMQGTMMGLMLVGMAGYVGYLAAKALLGPVTEGVGFVEKLKNFTGLGGGGSGGGAAKWGLKNLTSTPEPTDADQEGSTDTATNPPDQRTTNWNGGNPPDNVNTFWNGNDWQQPPPP